jgi:hypothetical protein
MAGCGKNLSQALEPAKAPRVSKHAVAGNGSSPAATRPPRRPCAYLASTDEKPGLAPSRALLAFDAGCLRRYANGGDSRGFVRIFVERLRRGAEGGCGGTRSRQRTGHTQHKATDLPAHLTLPHNQGRKVDGHFFDICPHRCSASLERPGGNFAPAAPVVPFASRGGSPHDQ